MTRLAWSRHRGRRRAAQKSEDERRARVRRALQGFDAVREFEDCRDGGRELDEEKRQRDLQRHAADDHAQGNSAAGLRSVRRLWRGGWRGREIPEECSSGLAPSLAFPRIWSEVGNSRLRTCGRGDGRRS